MKKNIALTSLLLCIGSTLFCFEQADLAYVRKHKRCSTQSCDLSRADLRKMLLNDGKFREADLSYANMEGRNLTSADFTDADLRGVNLKKTILKSTKFNGADLRKANLKGARHFKTADIEGAKFCNTTMPDGKVRNDYCE